MYSLNGTPFFLKKIKKIERTDIRTDGQTNGLSDYIMPQILFGSIKIPWNPCIYILNRFGDQKDNYEPIVKVNKALNPIDRFSETRVIIFRAFPFLSGKPPRDCHLSKQAYKRLFVFNSARRFWYAGFRNFLKNSQGNPGNLGETCTNIRRWRVPCACFAWPARRGIVFHSVPSVVIW